MSFAYRDHPLPAAFGQTTAKANFCEEDYIITSYLGEFVNTISSIAYVIYAIQGLRRLPRDSPFEAKSLYYGLGLVGVCSGLFHGLLKYHAQMSDDMSMIVATACVLHRAMTFEQSQKYTQRFTTVLLASMAVETIYHSVMDEEFVHQLSWLVLLVLVAWKTRGLIKSRVKGREEKRKLSHLISFGTANMVFGYILWTLDGLYCSQLIALRRYVGLPWGFLFELHGWWHFFTAVGAYVFMVMVDSLTREEVELSGAPFEWLGMLERRTKST